MAFKSHRLLTPTQNGKIFKSVASRLYENDIDFFFEELHSNNHIYFFDVTLDFEKNAEKLETNFDLSMFPFYEVGSYKNLTREQKLRGTRLNGDPAKEPAKLVSYLKKAHRTTDFVENLLYMVAFHGVTIIDIDSVIRSVAYPFYDPWLTTLQHEKMKNLSSVISKTIKNLGNSLCGRLHMRISEFLTAKLCLDRITFLKYTGKECFYDFSYINKNTSLETFDGKTQISNNLPSISSRVYSLRQVRVCALKRKRIVCVRVRKKYCARVWERDLQVCASERENYTRACLGERMARVCVRLGERIVCA